MIILKKLIGDKKEWKVMEARARSLPKDYRVVYDEIKQYIWKTSGLDGIEIFKGLLELFEEGAANGISVLDITGENVAEFCDELLRDADTYFEGWRKELNRNIAEKLGKRGESE
jgi:DNA-binding ferritin-like protein (Dps family)